MLSAVRIGVSRGAQPVLVDVSLSVDAGDRLGVVGPNGIGKSTLLAVLSGDLPPDEGRVERAPAALRVGLLRQERDALPGETLASYLARRTGVAAAGDELDRLTAALDGGGSDVLDDYGAALERYLALGGDDFEGRAAVTCAEVGLPADRMDVEVAALSGGQAARAGLAAILLSRFDVLLLDEPTNDLDFAGLARLEGFLAATPAAVVVVSHDRAFLDRAVTRMLEIAEHTHRGTEYAGGWSDYVERRVLARSQAGAAYDEWRAERRRLSERIRSQKSWAEVGSRKAKKPADKDKLRKGFTVNRTEKQASKVRISERALERLGTLDKPWEGWDLRFELRAGGRSGDVVSRLEGATLRRGGFTLGPVDLEVGWGERIAVVGPNGGGKSTLLALLTGEVAPDAGDARVGPGVTFGRIDQGRAALAGAPTLLDGFVTATGVLAVDARTTLAKYGLGAAHVGRPTSEMSPGERTRALLAVLATSEANCLVLDEPTNHLDLPAIERLEAALRDYDGTLLLVTHDRWMLETVETTRTIEVGAGAVLEVV